MLETDFIATWSPLTSMMPAPFRECKTFTLVCRAEPGTIEKLLPKPLTPSSKFPDVFSVTFMTSNVFGRTMDVAEIDFACEYRGVSGVHCPLEYTAPDESLVLGREAWSWPKKHAKFNWKIQDNHIEVEVISDAGTPVLKAKFKPDESCATQSSNERELVGFRDEVPYFQVTYRKQKTPDAVVKADIYRCDIPWGRSFSSISGRGELDVTDGPFDPMSVIRPIEIISASFDQHEFDFDLPEIIDTVDMPSVFDPYDVILFAMSKVSSKVLNGSSLANHPIISTKERNWDHLNPPLPKRNYHKSE